MFPSKSVLMSVPVGVLAFLASVCVYAGCGVQDPAGLDLRLSGQDVLIGEPLVLTIEVRNHSEQIHIVPQLDPKMGYLELVVTPPGEEERVLKPRLYVTSEKENYPLKPGQAIRHKEVQPPRDDFLKPGTYRIRVKMSLEGRELESNVLELDVREPSGAEAEAAKHFQTPEVQRISAGSYSESYEDLETVVREYSETQYAPWARYFLGWLWAMRAEKSSDPAAARRAIEELESLRAESPQFPLSDLAEYYSARERLRLEKDEASLQKVREIAEAHSDQAFFRTVSSQLQVYALADLVKYLP